MDVENPGVVRLGEDEELIVELANGQVLAITLLGTGGLLSSSCPDLSSSNQHSSGEKGQSKHKPSSSKISTISKTPMALHRA